MVALRCGNVNVADCEHDAEGRAARRPRRRRSRRSLHRIAYTGAAPIRVAGSIETASSAAPGGADGAGVAGVVAEMRAF
jgi:hypothetical protein